MSRREDALTKAAEWAAKAEAANTNRTRHLERAKNDAASHITRRYAQDSYDAAADAERDRQRAVEMAQMWTGIATADAGEPTP